MEVENASRSDVDRATDVAVTEADGAVVGTASSPVTLLPGDARHGAAAGSTSPTPALWSVDDAEPVLRAT